MDNEPEMLTVTITAPRRNLEYLASCSWGASPVAPVCDAVRAALEVLEPRVGDLVRITTGDDVFDEREVLMMTDATMITLTGHTFAPFGRRYLTEWNRAECMITVVRRAEA